MSFMITHATINMLFLSTWRPRFDYIKGARHVRDVSKTIQMFSIHLPKDHNVGPERLPQKSKRCAST